MPSIPRTTWTAIIGLPIIAATTLHGQDFDGEWPSPTADRWNYGFNQTPGARNVASVFGYTGDLYDFDERDGQFIVAFDTSDLIATGAGPDRYQVDEIEVTVTIASDLPIGYDPTNDDWRTYLPVDDPDATPDADPGRPVELFTTGFRNGITAQDWAEDTVFSPSGPFGTGLRNAYAADLDLQANPVDVSNSISDRRNPTSLAVGIADDTIPGGDLLEGSVMRFTFTGEDPQVAAWLGSSLDAGRIHFSISSLIEAEQEGGDFFEFYTRENPLVTVGVRSAATLRIAGAILGDCMEPGDLDHDCSISGGDIGILLSRWGTDDPEADLDGSGLVDGADFGFLLSLF